MTAGKYQKINVFLSAAPVRSLPSSNGMKRRFKNSKVEQKVKKRAGGPGPVYRRQNAAASRNATLRTAREHRRRRALAAGRRAARHRPNRGPSDRETDCG